VGDLSAFLDTIAPEGRPARKALLEKDYHLHRMLAHIGDRPGLRDELLFKGGTCLLMAYLGYYRFSEDVDFTWRDQERWLGKTTRRTRNECSDLIGTMAIHIEEMAKDLGLRFVPDKSDNRYIIASSGGRMARFYLWFDSVVVG
jgi:hypothetical protein